MCVCVVCVCVVCLVFVWLGAHVRACVKAQGLGFLLCQTVRVSDGMVGVETSGERQGL